MEKKWDNLDIALIHVPGLVGRPLPLNVGDLAAGDEIAAVGIQSEAGVLFDSDIRNSWLGDLLQLFGAMRANTVTGEVIRIANAEVRPIGGFSSKVVQHTVPMLNGSMGYPLINACREVVAINTGSSVIGRSFAADGTPVSLGKGDAGVALHADALAGLVRLAGVQPKVLVRSCAEAMTRTYFIWAAVVLVLAILAGVALAFYLGRRRAALAGAGGYPPGAIEIPGGFNPATFLQGLTRRLPGTGRPVASPREDHYLVPKGSRHVGGEYCIDFSAAAGSGVIIGRAPRAGGLTLPFPQISREHLRFTYVGDAFLVEDMGSRNGSRINGRTLAPRQPVPIRSGDELSVVDLRFQFLSNGDWQRRKLSDRSSRGVQWVLRGSDPATGEAIVIEFDASDLGPDGLRVGRDPDACDAVIAHNTVSARGHCLLHLKGGVLSVTDLDSTNGTRVDGSRLAPGKAARLRAGQRLTIGAVEMVVQKNS